MYFIPRACQYTEWPYLGINACTIWYFVHVACSPCISEISKNWAALLAMLSKDEVDSNILNHGIQFF